jgi:hypothetical protein
VNATTFRLRDASGDVVPASVAYDDDARTATLTPSSPLDGGAAYTAQLSTGIRSDDETPLPDTVTWSFSTLAPTAPIVVATSPVDGATELGESPAVTATFSQPMNASTITASTFTLTAPGGATVAASVAYDAATRTATLTPSSPLASGTVHTAHLASAIASASGLALEQPHAWGFTTSSCPCQLFGGAYSPAISELSTANGRSGSGWTLELGAKIGVTQAASLTAIRFFKSASETGTHIGRLWTVQGQLLASVTFSGESNSGWQQQALATPVALVPGQTYVVSVGMNERFVMTIGGLANSLTGGPLFSIDDGANGVFADAAGSFPSNHWSESNYGIDAVIR